MDILEQIAKYFRVIEARSYDGLEPSLLDDCRTEIERLRKLLDESGRYAVSVDAAASGCRDYSVNALGERIACDNFLGE